MSASALRPCDRGKRIPKTRVGPQIPIPDPRIPGEGRDPHGPQSRWVGDAVRKWEGVSGDVAVMAPLCRRTEGEETVRAEGRSGEADAPGREGLKGRGQEGRTASARWDAQACSTALLLLCSQGRSRLRVPPRRGRSRPAVFPSKVLRPPCASASPDRPNYPYRLFPLGSRSAGRSPEFKFPRAPTNTRHQPTSADIARHRPKPDHHCAGVVLRCGPRPSSTAAGTTPRSARAPSPHRPRARSPAARGPSRRPRGSASRRPPARDHR